VAAATRLALLPASPQTVVIVCGAMYALAYGGAMTAARMLVPEEWALVRAMLDRSRMIPARRNVIC
jgi:hypothetical protein